MTTSTRSNASPRPCTNLATFRTRADVPLPVRRSAVPPLTRVTGKRHNTLSASQNLADNFENVMVTYASIFTGPQAQIPSSPYQQGLGLVRGYTQLVCASSNPWKPGTVTRNSHKPHSYGWKIKMFMYNQKHSVLTFRTCREARNLAWTDSPRLLDYLFKPNFGSEARCAAALGNRSTVETSPHLRSQMPS